MEILSRAFRARLRLAPYCAALVMTLAAGLAQSVSAQAQTAQEAVQEGVALFQEGRIPEAIDRLRRAGEVFPEEPMVWMVLGQVYEASRQPQAAIPLSRKLIELAPTSEDAKRAAARLGQVGRDPATYEAAQRDFQAAVQAFTARDLAAAEVGFLKVLDRIPTHLPSLLFLGTVAEQIGRDEEALSRWTAAVGVDATFYPAQVNLGRLYERRDRVEDAVSAYRAAVETGATHPDVQFAARRLTQLGATPDQARQVRQWLEDAAKAISEGRIDDARQAFERVLAVLPTHAPASLALALMAAKRGQTIDAVRILKKGLEGDPDYYPALFLLAEIESGHGQFEQAMEHYTRVLALAGPRREGIEARRRLPRLEEAVANLKTIKVTLFIEARNAFNEGIEAFQKQDNETAFKAFSRAMALDEKNPYYVFNRGLAAFNLGNNLVAAESFNRVIALEPTFGLAHFWLGVLFQASAEQARDAGSLPEAEAEYKATVEKFSSAIQHGEGAWFIEEAQKRRGEAVAYLQQYQESLGYITVGGVLGAQNRLDEALAVFTASAKRFPYDYQPFLNIGAILTDRKQYAEAQEVLEHAAKVNPKSPKPHLQMGFLFEEQKRLDDAAAAYRKVMELAPDSPEPHASLGTVLMQKEAYPEATTEFEQAVDLRRASEDNIATLEQRLRPYRFTLRATPWAYDTNIGSRANPVGEASSQIGGTVSYWLVNEEKLKVRGTLDPSEVYYLLFRQVVDTSTGVGAAVDYAASPVVDVNGGYRWSYSHGSTGPQALSQSLSGSLTKRGQLPSGLTLGLSYVTSSGLGESTVRAATLGYSLGMNQALGKAGSISTSFSASSNDHNRRDQVSQYKAIGFGYSRPLWGGVNASFTYNVGFRDFVNPTREQDPTTGRSSLVFRQNTSKTYGLDFSYQFRNDLILSLGMNLERNEANFSLDRSEDLEELLNNLVQAAGTFRKQTMSLSVSKTF